MVNLAREKNDICAQTNNTHNPQFILNSCFFLLMLDRDEFEDQEQEEVATTPRDLVQNCYDKKTDAGLKAYHILTENMEDPALLFQMVLSAKDNSAQEDIGELVRHDDPETLEELFSPLH